MEYAENQISQPEDNNILVHSEKSKKDDKSNLYTKLSTLSTFFRVDSNLTMGRKQEYMFCGRLMKMQNTVPKPKKLLTKIKPEIKKKIVKLSVKFLQCAMVLW